MENNINYKPITEKAKSVPMFPKGINRIDDFGRIDGDFNPTPTKTPDELAAEEQQRKDKETADAEAARIAAEEAEKNKGNNQNQNDSIIDFTSPDLEYDEEKGFLNDKGEVIKSKEDLVKEGYFNEEGKLINPTTKELINIEPAEDVPFIQEIQTVLGYEILDEKGTPKKYEDTTQGIADLIKDIAEVQHKKSQQEFLQSNPELVAYYNHLKAGGNRESFFNYRPKDYTTIDLTTLDVEQKANVIYEDYISKGLTPARAKALVEMHKTANEIDAVSDESLKSLVKSQKDKEEADKKAAEEADKRAAEEVSKYWNKVNSTVKAGKIGNILIPEADKEDFLNYISAPVDSQGNTKHNIDAAKEDVDFHLQLAYWRYKGYDFNKMVKNLVNTEKVITLRERVKQSKKVSNQQDIRDKGNNDFAPGNSSSLQTIN